jgi:hypothetical protein
MRAPKKKAGEKLRPWRVLLMRARAQELGIVYEADEKPVLRFAFRRAMLSESYSTGSL